MNRYWLALAVLPAVASVARAEEHQYRTASWYAAHPTERANVMAICRDNAGLANRNPNCGNAAQGGIDRIVQEYDRHNGASRDPASSDYWRTASAADLRFYKTQCQRQTDPAAQRALFCSAIKASGN